MSARAELEAALRNAEAELRAASHELDMAESELTRTNANWNQLIADRRRSVTDRRKAGTAWSGPFPDRRIATSDRRMRDDGVAALAQKVADQHEIYLARSKAEAGCVAAKARLSAAIARRELAIGALDALNRAQS
jgi:multidrug resistance efflux pump